MGGNYLISSFLRTVFKRIIQTSWENALSLHLLPAACCKILSDRINGTNSLRLLLRARHNTVAVSGRVGGSSSDPLLRILGERGIFRGKMFDLFFTPNLLPPYRIYFAAMDEKQ